MDKIVKLNVQNWMNLSFEKSVNMKFLCELLPHFSDAKNEQLLSMTPTLKKQIANRLGWNESTALNRCSVELCKLRDLGIITRIEQQVYQLNPNYIGIGEDEDINTLKSLFWVRKPREKAVNNKQEQQEYEENEIIEKRVFNERDNKKEENPLMKIIVEKSEEILRKN